MYSDLYTVNAELLSDGLGSNDFTGLISEVDGGITCYYQNALIEHLACFLAWEKPTQGHDVNSVEHPEWEGWCTRGWDIDINRMSENLKINNITFNDATRHPILWGNLTVGFAVSQKHQKDQQQLFDEFVKHPRSGLEYLD